VTGSRLAASTSRGALRPATRAPLFGLAQLADGDRRVDETHVGVGLRKVAQEPAALGIDVLGEEAERIGVRQDAVERLLRVVEAAHERECLDPPETADGE